MTYSFRDRCISCIVVLLLGAALPPAVTASEQKGSQTQIGQTTIGQTTIGKTTIGPKPAPIRSWSSAEMGKRYGQRFKDNDLNYRRERCSRRASAHGLAGLEHQKFVTACMFPW